SVYPRARNHLRGDVPLRPADGASNRYPLVLVPDDMSAGKHVPVVEQHPGTTSAPVHSDPPSMLRMEVLRHVSNGKGDGAMTVRSGPPDLDGSAYADAAGRTTASSLTRRLHVK